MLPLQSNAGWSNDVHWVVCKEDNTTAWPKVPCEFENSPVQMAYLCDEAGCGLVGFSFFLLDFPCFAGISALIGSWNPIPPKTLRSQGKSSNFDTINAPPPPKKKNLAKIARKTTGSTFMHVESPPPMRASLAPGQRGNLFHVFCPLLVTLFLDHSNLGVNALSIGAEIWASNGNNLFRESLRELLRESGFRMT